MKEAIIVMPNAANKYGVSFYTNNEVQGNYEDYIVKDVVSYIDSHFRTIPHFNFRALTGHSAGGYGALKLGMKHPHVFGRVAGLSPGQFPTETIYGMAQFMLAEDQMWGSTGPSIPYHPLYPFKFVNNTVYSLAAAFLPNPENPPYYVDIPFNYDDNYDPVLNEELMGKFNSNSLFALASEYKVGIRKLKTFYFDIGTNDDLFMYQPNQALHEYLNQMHIKHQYEEYDGTHFNKMFEHVWVKSGLKYPMIFRKKSSNPLNFKINFQSLLQKGGFLLPFCKKYKKITSTSLPKFRYDTTHNHKFPWPAFRR